LNYTRLVQTRHPYIRSDTSISFRRVPSFPTNRLQIPFVRRAKILTVSSLKPSGFCWSCLFRHAAGSV